jgi:predicted nucleic acid-binding Zn ribbon protein
MTERRIDVQCPKCKFKFKVPLGEALMPVIEEESRGGWMHNDTRSSGKPRDAAAKDSDERNCTPSQ